MIRKYGTTILCILLLTSLTSCTRTQRGEDVANGMEKVHEDYPMALYNCLIIDGTGAEPIEDGIILIRNGLIVEITDKNSTIPHEYREIDLAGRTVLPGFINAHVHNAHLEEQLQKWAAAGVTTVRDLNPRLDNFIEIRDDLNHNVHNARVISSTPIITVSQGYGSSFVNSFQETEKITQSYIDAGVDIIKFSLEDSLAGQNYPLLSKDKVMAITDTARANNRRTSVHVTHVRNLPLAIDGKVNDLAHMVVEPLGAKIIEDIIDLDIYWVPTLELWQGVSTMYGIDWDQIAIANVNKFYKAGGKIALGTDFGGFSTDFDPGFPITEVRMMKQAGMSNMDIIIAGTKNAAYVCHQETQIGTLEAGKIADLLIIDGNPLLDIENLTRPHLVIRSGIIAYSQ